MFVVKLLLQQLIFHLSDKIDETLEELISFVLGSVMTGTTK